jgi:DNA-directed RNA polymerase subunit L
MEAERLKVIKDKEDGHLNATYGFIGEDHTLGNLLRSVLMKE